MVRSSRFDELSRVPMIAALDHRHFLDENGEDRRLAGLSRQDRRRIKAAGLKLGNKYNQVMAAIAQSGAGYPVDKLIRQLAIEYTNRYASSGLHNQPASFNYFEAFCQIRLFEDSVAPYVEPAEEVDHLFSVSDYFDFLTSDQLGSFKHESLLELPEGKSFHFSQNGRISDFSYMTAEGKEFLISGFSMIRHGNSLHWYILGGEVLSEAEWKERTDNEAILSPDSVPASKRPFLTEAMKESANKVGAPVRLQGADSAVRTVIAGETDLGTSKHVARCYMQETEHAFALYCDDPEVFTNIANLTDRSEIIDQMRERVESAAVMWNLAEAFFQLPTYFQFRLTVDDNVVKESGRSRPKTTAASRGQRTNFRHVTSIEVSDEKPSVLRSYTAPNLEVDTEGYWRRLDNGANGQDRNV